MVSACSRRGLSCHAGPGFAPESAHAPRLHRREQSDALGAVVLGALAEARPGGARRSLYVCWQQLRDGNRSHGQGWSALGGGIDGCICGGRLFHQGGVLIPWEGAIAGAAEGFSEGMVASDGNWRGASTGP